MLKIKRLEEKIEYKKNEKERLQEEIKKKNDSSSTLTGLKLKKEEDLQTYKDKFFSKFYFISIWKLEDDIKQIQKVEDLEDEIQKLKEDIIDLSESVWGGFPKTLDQAVYDKCAEQLNPYTECITADVKYINILVLGENGSGKSSFLNTCATALENSKNIKDYFRVSSDHNYEHSATSVLHFENMFLKNKPLFIKLFDMPGMAKDNTVREEEVNMVINGEICPDAIITKASQMRMNNRKHRENPTFADKMHCILYVVKSSSNIEMSPYFKAMQRIRMGRKSEDDVRQFAIVTAIDKCGAPNDKMEKAYRYPRFKEICRDICGALDLDEYHVIPVSNYFGEGESNVAKNAMSLFALWRILSSGRDYIKRKL